MANQAQVTHPLAGNVTAGAPIAGIKVRASGHDSVDAPSSQIGILVGGVFASSAALQATGTADVYEPDGAVVATMGAFKIRARVQFASGGMPSEVIVADSNTFTGVAGGMAMSAPRSESKPAKKAKKSARPAAKAGAKKSKKPAARPAAKSKAKRKPAAKKKAKPAAKRAAKPKRKK